MKFVGAIGILSQTLPVVSKTKLSSWVHSKRRSDQGNLEAVEKHSTIRALTGGSGSFEDRSGRTSRISRQAKSHGAGASYISDEAQACDPSSMNPESGILSCGPDALCEPNQASVLGGRCVADASSRHNNWEEDTLTLTKPGNLHFKALSRKLKNSHSYSSRTMDEDFCDPLSSDPDIGILSCGIGRQCEPSHSSSLGGQCMMGMTNSPRLTQRLEAVECVTAEPDVGLLACGGGQTCVESEESLLGGFCVGDSVRHLVYSSSYDGRLCDPESDQYGIYDCNCSAFDNSTKTGTIPCQTERVCLGTRYYGCYDICRATTVSWAFQYNEISSLEKCYQFMAGDDETTKSTVCVKFPFSSAFNYTYCEVAVDGQSCSSCTLTMGGTALSFDCKNVADGFTRGPGDYFSRIPILQACYQPTQLEYCNLCADDFFLYPFPDIPVYLDGFGNSFSCAELYEAAYRFAQIPTDKCPDAAALAVNTECCVPQVMLENDYVCDICGGIGVIKGDKFQLAVYTPGLGNVTCGDVFRASYFNGDLTTASCPIVRESVRNKCCSYDECLLCGDGDIAFPDANITTSMSVGDTSCYLLQLAAADTTEAQCEYFRSLAGPCCASSSTSSGTNQPSGSPIGGVEPTGEPVVDSSKPGDPQIAPSPNSGAYCAYCALATQSLIVLMGTSILLALPYT